MGGVHLICVTVCLLPGEANDIECMGVPFLGATSATLVYGSLFMKSWRIWRLFDNPRLKKLKIRERDVWKRLGLFLICQWLIIAIWFVNPSTATVVEEMLDNGAVNRYQSCQGDWDFTVYGVLIALHLISSTVGCFLAFKTRKFDKNYSESPWIAAA